MTLVLSVLEQGMIYAIMALGIYITYTILDFPDLTVDGSFPLGAALSAVLITKGVNPILTLLVTFAAGAFAGMLTGIIHVKLKVRDLLSGIIMMTALYTVNLRIAGRANLPIYNMTTLFDNDFVRNVFKGGLAQFSNVIIILVITLVMKFLLDWYMSTKSGYLLRAVGDNETIVTSMGVDKGITKIIGLAIANGLCSLSGCIFAQQQRYFDISMGTGTMVIGLASVIIGISLLKKATFLRVTSSMLNIICGSIPIDGGSIVVNGTDITRQKDFIRHRRIGRVFQDPSKGTCPSMTILENLSIADNKGKTYGLGRGTNHSRIDHYKEMLAELNLGLEDKLHTKVGALSGGQRQTLALLMATMNPIEFLILDEHTAALDPKTAEIVMQLTGKIVAEKKVTTIMVTHNLRYAVEYGDRLIMMHQGKAIIDKAGADKKAMQVDDILGTFNEISIECGN